jgi:hypothetical protein
LANEIEKSPDGGAAVAPARRGWGRIIWPAVTFGLMLASFGIGRYTGGLNSLPTIARTLPGDESGFSRELNDRIRTLFPIGASEDKLIGYLGDEKFTPEWRRRDDPNASYYFRQGLLCNQIIRVVWRADSKGALTEVSGSYQSQCL